MYIYTKRQFLKNQPKKSALSEVNGVNQPDSLSKTVVKKIQQRRKIIPTSNELIEAIKKSDNLMGSLFDN